ncbi:MAG: NCS2 family permease [Breznakia sp.]
MKKFFKLKEHNTNVSTEILAGVTTFFTMAYILIVNPQILGEAGMPTGGVFIATIIASVIGTLVMGLFANVPYALAPGMGLNAFFTYTVVLGAGFSWQEALGMVFICGIINIIITFTNIRKSIITSIPESLQHAIGGGIGLFIAYIGCINVGFISFGAVPALSAFSDPSMILAIIGILLTTGLVVCNIKGGMLLGILLTTIIGIPMGVVDLGSITFDSYGQMFSDFGSIFAQGIGSNGLLKLFNDMGDVDKLLFILVTIFSFSLSDTFDTIGTFIGTGRRSGIFSKEDEIALETGKGFSSKMDKALFADSIATSIGAILGTSNTTTYVESSAGIAAGGRTGLTSLTVAICFLISILIWPIISIVPTAATSPALIVVGVMMTSSFADIKWNDLEEAVPCFFAVLFMTVAYSISTGIAMGFIMYFFVKLIRMKFNEISPILLVSVLLFIINFILSAIK